jgi:hypothetical protein
MNLTPEQVKSLAIRTEKRIVQTPLSEGEIAEIQDQFIQDNLKMNVLKNELATVSLTFKNSIKEIQNKLSENLRKLKDKFSEDELDCYLVDNQDSGEMEYYKEDGTKVFARPLRPDERQTNAFSQLRKVEG